MMAEAAADQLSNTPTIARNSYVHPAVIDLAGGAAIEIDSADDSGLFAAERRMLSFLENHAD